MLCVKDTSVNLYHFVESSIFWKQSYETS